MGSGGIWGLQKVTFAQCVCEKTAKEREGCRERKKKGRKSGKAGLDQLNDSTVLGVMEKALWGNIQYARVSSCMQSLQ